MLVDPTCTVGVRGVPCASCSGPRIGTAGAVYACAINTASRKR